MRAHDVMMAIVRFNMDYSSVHTPHPRVRIVRHSACQFFPVPHTHYNGGLAVRMPHMTFANADAALCKTVGLPNRGHGP